MRQFFNLTKDASIYEEFTSRNTGHDEILEVGKNSEGTKVIRSLIQFNTSELSSSLSNASFPASTSFELKLFIARADDLQLGQTIEVYPVSRSWVEGSGYFYQNINVPYTSSRTSTAGYTENDGVTWSSRQSGSRWSVTGSEFTSSMTTSTTLTDPITDVSFDITSMVRGWISGTLPNNGLLLKFSNQDESNTSNIGNVRFFSRQTHTIYSPSIIAKYNDQVFITGSISGSNTAQCIVTPKNLQPRYKTDEFVRVDLSVRDRYPLKTFDTVFSNYVGNQRLPQTSYFSIVDVQSNTVIVPFDDYSRVHCDGTGSYFEFRVQGMYPGRFYKTLIKVVDTRYTRIFDPGHHFTVEQV